MDVARYDPFDRFPRVTLAEPKVRKPLKQRQI
ncbi:hypothetical protein HNQ72_005464 [Rhizobium wenxiniae]|uniref:Uncharacterized protein n=1 Tax=Rhizobium wenxiniae TaxID=1737357 RepID=A0A7W9YBL2_9HYPH|nr:hypothetical protein [Rhizobium wenxiniae]